MPKPHPYGLEKITAGFEKKFILHIGDSLGDLEGAESFGIPVIAACWNNINQVKNFEQRTPYIAITPSDCREIIAKIFSVNL